MKKIAGLLLAASLAFAPGPNPALAAASTSERIVLPVQLATDAPRKPS